MISNFKFQISDFEAAFNLAESVFSQFETCDVFEIAEKSGMSIIYQKWFPVTLGEFDWKSKTIIVNENAGIEKEKIVAHELGHYFLKEFAIKITDEERFCDEFADELLKEFHAKAQRTQS